MAKFVSDSHSRALAGLLGALGIVAAASAAVLSMKPPMMLSAQQRYQLEQAIETRSSFSVPTRDRNVSGLTILLLVSSAGGFIGCYLLIGDEPRTLDPVVVLPKEKLPKVMAEPEREQIKKQLHHPLMQVLSANPWMLKLAKAPVVVIIAPQGAGKSSIANFIVLLREILFGWNSRILDPHATLNLERGTWTQGEVFEDPQAMAMMARDGLLPRQPEDTLTTVHDEFSRWHRTPELATVPEAVLTSASQDVRKYHIKHVVLLHGDNKGMGGGEDLPSGLLASVLDQAAVLRVTVDSDEFGEFAFTGKARFKAPGIAETDSNYEPVVIPKAISPARIKRDIGKYLQVLGIRPTLRRPQSEDSTGERVRSALESHPDIRSEVERLERTVQIQVGERLVPGDGVELPQPPVPDFAGFAAVANGPEFLFYLKGKDCALDQAFPVAKLRDNWGKDRGLGKAADLREFLMLAASSYALGSFSEEAPEWVCGFDAEAIPDAFPER